MCMGILYFLFFSQICSVADCEGVSSKHAAVNGSQINVHCAFGQVAADFLLKRMAAQTS